MSIKDMVNLAATPSDNCPKCGSPRIGFTSPTSYGCGSSVEHNGLFIEGMSCVKDQLAAALARIVELEELTVEQVGVIDEIQEDRDRLRDGVKALAEKLEEIVCVKDPDRGVVLLSNDGPTHYDAEAQCQVYDHENFSPLGDALIALHDGLTALIPESKA